MEQTTAPAVTKTHKAQAKHMETLSSERLGELDRELTNGRRNAVVYTNENGRTTKIIVSRVHAEPRRWPDVRDYTASATVDGREFAKHGMLPSHAIARLVEALRSAVGGIGLEAAAINSDLPSTVN